MPYRVKEPAVSVLLKIGEVVDTDGKHIGYEHASETFVQDEVVYEEPDKAKEAGQTGPISPDVVRLYDEGDEHVRAVLEKVSSPASKGGRPKKADSE